MKRASKVRLVGSVVVLGLLALGLGVHEAAAAYLYDAGAVERLLAPSADLGSLALPALFVALRLALITLGPGVALAAVATVIFSLERRRERGEAA